MSAVSSSTGNFLVNVASWSTQCITSNSIKVVALALKAIAGLGCLYYLWQLYKTCSDPEDNLSSEWKLLKAKALILQASSHGGGVDRTKLLEAEEELLNHLANEESDNYLRMQLVKAWAKLDMGVASKTFNKALISDKCDVSSLTTLVKDIYSNSIDKIKKEPIKHIPELQKLLISILDKAKCRVLNQEESLSKARDLITLAESYLSYAMDIDKSKEILENLPNIEKLNDPERCSLMLRVASLYLKLGESETASNWITTAGKKDHFDDLIKIVEFCAQNQGYEELGKHHLQIAGQLIINMPLGVDKVTCCRHLVSIYTQNKGNSKYADWSKAQEILDFAVNSFSAIQSNELDLNALEELVSLANSLRLNGREDQSLQSLEKVRTVLQSDEKLDPSKAIFLLLILAEEFHAHLREIRVDEVISLANSMLHKSKNKINDLLSILSVTRKIQQPQASKSCSIQLFDLIRKDTDISELYVTIRSMKHALICDEELKSILDEKWTSVEKSRKPDVNLQSLVKAYIEVNPKKAVDVIEQYPSKKKRVQMQTSLISVGILALMGLFFHKYTPTGVYQGSR